ncbi:hypothetical protein [Streptomyces lavendulae]|uniref:hypothetical protein n=1 Tax=Streptomyces lavendulae TaxID=1914 RepID=UPI0036EB6D49
MAQKLWVQAVSRGHGCNLVSPWISPTMLIPVGLGPQEDLNMWWTVFEPGQGWNEDQKFTSHHSGANPALASYNGRLVCVHRGGTDNDPWYTSFHPDSGWTEDTRIGGMSTDGPALAVFGGKLHCVYKSHTTNVLWHATLDGGGWSRHNPLPAHQSSRGPALAAFGGKLHLVHRGGGSDNSLFHATYDGSGWSTDRRLPAHETASNPALAEYDGKLHLLHRGGHDTHLWHSTYDGSNWTGSGKLGAHQSLEGPALAVFGGELYCIHRGHGNGDQHLWWTKFRTGGRWAADQQFPDHWSGAGPAAVVYKDKNGTHDQIMVVYRGWGKKAAGSDAAEVEARLAAEQAAATAPEAPLIHRQGRQGGTRRRGRR